MFADGLSAALHDPLGCTGCAMCKLTRWPPSWIPPMQQPAPTSLSIVDCCVNTLQLILSFLINVTAIYQVLSARHILCANSTCIMCNSNSGIITCGLVAVSFLSSCLQLLGDALRRQERPWHALLLAVHHCGNA